VIGGVAVPARATVGDAVAMSGRASDALSRVTITWDFGDGSQATGGSVRHTFGTPGAHVVTVRAVDGAGNTASAPRIIAVKSPASADGRAPAGAAVANGSVVVFASASAGLPAGDGARRQVYLQASPRNSH
jgi:hypothetical protein